MSDVSDVRLRKAELRAQVLARRSALPAHQRSAAATLIRDAVLAEPQVQETLRTAGVDLEPGDPEALRVVMADPVRSGVDLMDRIGFRPQ